jgi:hypothetical protein
MSITNPLETIRRGVDFWNRWRQQNPGVAPQFDAEDLSEMDLTGVNLAESNLSNAELFESNLCDANLKMAVLAGSDLAGANLSRAEIYKADLTGASLIGANLSEAYLAEANLKRADLRGVSLRGADLTSADLSEANIVGADLTGAKLNGARLVRADLRNANLAGADLSGVQYGSFRSMRGRYYGIRGLDSCFGNPLFVRDARDQDYLDTMEISIERTRSAVVKRWKRSWFNAWGLIDYGRSLAKTALYAFVIAMLFGVVYQLDGSFGWGLIEYPSTARSPLSPFSFSIVTYTKLGFGGITPTHWLGEIILVCERILGFVTLGLLLSILASRVARRS